MLESRPPFPGMDPWLEHPALWPDVHNSLIVAIRDALVPLVDPRYTVGVETRITFLTHDERERVARPDITVQTRVPATATTMSGVGLLEQTEVDLEEVELSMEDEIVESYLEIREFPGERIVTAIELLSPTNKVSVEGRGQYLAKRFEFLHSRTNLIEIDLMRAGLPIPLKGPVRPSDYRILVSRGTQRPKASLYRFRYTDAIPLLPIPLLPGEAEPMLDLNPVLHGQIERARYFRRIDYTREPVPPLRPEDRDWAAAVIGQAAQPSPITRD